LIQTLEARFFEQRQCIDQCDFVVIAFAIVVTNHDPSFEVVGGD